MTDEFWEGHNKIEITLYHLECLLEGAYQVAEWAPDKRIECGLLALARQELQEAQQLATAMAQAHRETKDAPRLDRAPEKDT